MKYKSISRILFLCMLLCGIASCNNHAPTQETIVTKTDTTITVKNDSIENDRCAGAVPEHSVVDSSKYPDRKFQLHDRVGYDRFTTAKGDTVYIDHSNCEYVTFKIRIVTHRLSHDTADVKYWANVASDILSEISPAMNAVVDMDSANYFLKEHYAKLAAEKAPIREEIIYRRIDGDFLSIVTFNNIEYIDNNYVLTVFLTRGPL